MKEIEIFFEKFIEFNKRKRSKNKLEYMQSIKDIDNIKLYGNREIK